MFIKLFELCEWDFSESLDYRNKKFLKKKIKTDHQYCDVAIEEFKNFIDYFFKTKSNKVIKITDLQSYISYKDIVILCNVVNVANFSLKTFPELNPNSVFISYNKTTCKN